MSNAKIKTETASFKLTPEMLKAAHEKARAYDMTLSQLLRTLLKMLLDEKIVIIYE